MQHLDRGRQMKYDQGMKRSVKIISGGQTGVDRAALDAALRLGLPCGGWCPRGRMAEDGTISLAYPLTETPRRVYEERTEWNVRDSDGTLIIVYGPPTGGTALTIVYAKQQGRPWHVVDLAAQPGASAAKSWLEGRDIQVLNVAGPRENTAPGIHARAVRFLETLLSACTAA